MVMARSRPWSGHNTRTYLHNDVDTSPTHHALHVTHTLDIPDFPRTPRPTFYTRPHVSGLLEVCIQPSVSAIASKH